LEALGEGLRGGQVRKRRRVRSPDRAREEVKLKERADERRWSAGDARLAQALGPVTRRDATRDPPELNNLRPLSLRRQIQRVC